MKNHKLHHVMVSLLMSLIFHFIGGDSNDIEDNNKGGIFFVTHSSLFSQCFGILCTFFHIFTKLLLLSLLFLYFFFLIFSPFCHFFYIFVLFRFVLRVKICSHSLMYEIKSVHKWKKKYGCKIFFACIFLSRFLFYFFNNTQKNLFYQRK